MKSGQIRRVRRSEEGASIALAAAFIFVCILLIYFGFNMSVLMGGSRQVRNSVDAAVLNVGKRVVETKVSPAPAFSDVADSSGTVGLSNINRVWGKALLVNANAKEMKQEGLDPKSEAAGSADLSYKLAQQANDKLVARLNDKTTLNMYFRHTAKQRGASLLGSAAALDKAGDTRYQTAMVGRGVESNIKFKQSQLPTGTTVDSVQSCGGDYLEGYDPINVNGKSFMFTSFRNGEMPHLISDTIFEKNKPTVLPTGGVNPVPNAWHASGIVVGEKDSLRASASAVANPQRTFNLAIPHGFIAIRVTNISRWYVQEKLKKVKGYGKTPTTYHELVDEPMGEEAVFNGYANLGNEYKAPSLMAYVDKVPGSKEIMLDKMTQRLRQVDPEYSKKRLRSLMASQKIDPQANTYYIFPKYSSPDKTDPNITMEPDTGKLPGWLQKNGPEGGSAKLVDENELEGEPNSCRAEPVTGKRPECLTIFTGKVYWRPGTGFNQCLGEVWLARETKIYFTPNGTDPHPSGGSQ